MLTTEMAAEAQLRQTPRSQRRVAAPVMLGLTPVRVISFLLLAAGAALCQQRIDNPERNSLPDAPSAEISRMLADQGRGPLAAGAAGSDEAANRESGSGSPAAQIRFWPSHEDEAVQRNSRDFLAKYVSPTLSKRNLNYHPSTSGSFMGRATYAASSIFVTRDGSGRRRLNTTYFIGMLSSAVIHTAYRPYWRRSVAEPFCDFGSNIGNDAGMNFLHEFGPGLQQLVKSHAPKFVSKIEERISHN
jgi:hypothetical protein